MKKYYLCVLSKEPIFIINDEDYVEIFPDYPLGVISYLKEKRINPYSIVKSYRYKFQSTRSDSEFSFCEINLHYCGAVSLEIPENKQTNINSSQWFKETWVINAYLILKGFFINVLNTLPTESLSLSGYCDGSLIICKDKNEYKHTFHSNGSQTSTRFINACDIYVCSPADDNFFINLAYPFSFTGSILISQADIGHKEYVEMTDSTQSFFIPLNKNLAITYGQLGIKHTYIFYAWKAIEELANSVYIKYIESPAPHKINVTLKKLKSKGLISESLYTHLDQIRLHRNDLIHDPSLSFMLIDEKIQTETDDILICIDDLTTILKMN